MILKGSDKAVLRIVLCRFFMFYLLTFLVHQWSVALFRMMGALCRNLVVANAVGMMVMLLVFLVTCPSLERIFPNSCCKTARLD